MVGQLCRGIDHGNGRSAWNVRAARGAETSAILLRVLTSQRVGLKSMRTTLSHLLSKVHVIVRVDLVVTVCMIQPIECCMSSIAGVYDQLSRKSKVRCIPALTVLPKEEAVVTSKRRR
jgi:hypothetical protein